MGRVDNGLITMRHLGFDRIEHLQNMASKATDRELAGCVREVECAAISSYEGLMGRTTECNIDEAGEGCVEIKRRVPHREEITVDRIASFGSH